MTLRLWPDTLPVLTLDGYSLSPMDQSIRTDMEVGFARQRRLTTARHDIIEGSWLFTDAEMVAFRAFHGDQAWSLSGDSDDLSGWSVNAASVTSDAGNGPDVGVLADKIVENTATATHYAQRLLPTADVPQNSTILFRATLKAAGRTYGRIVFQGWDGLLRRTDADLSAGTLGAQLNILSRTIEPRGAGWHRVTITAETATGSTPPLVRINALSADNTSSYLGDGTSGVLVCEVQARIVTGYDLFLRTGPNGRVTGADGGQAWFLMPVAVGGGLVTTECRFQGPWRAEALPGLGWRVTGRLEVRNA